MDLIDDPNAKWLRKATDLERMFEIGHQNHVYLTHYTLHLSSVESIDENIIRKALNHLYKQIPVLRVCLQNRNGELWLKEMDQCKIDLEIVAGDLKAEQDKLTGHTYNSEKGPLWCFRFLYVSRSQEMSSNPVSSQKNDFPFQYALIFGIHHSIADGTTNVKICNLLCNILNDITSGKFVSDEHQIGEVTGDEEIFSLYDQGMIKLKKDPKLCEDIKRELEEGSNVRPLIRNICKIPSDTVIMTKNVEVTFNRETSEKFYKKAKSKGIYLHSALTGVINLALIKLLQEEDVVQEKYNIRAGHDINVRRYYKGDTSRILGVHGPMFGYRSSFIVPIDMLSSFWETVRDFQDKFHADISNQKVLTTCAYRIMTEDTNQNFEELFRADGEPNYYYTISNMGNLNGRLTEGGDSVKVDKLTRFSSLRNRGSFMCIYIHTFRGQLNMSFAYSTRFLTHEFVNRLKELFHTYMLAVCDI